MSDFVEVKRGFRMIQRGDRWHLHYNLLGVVTVQAENESDALVKMTTRLQEMRSEANRPSLRDLYAWAANWVGDYRQ